MSQDEGASIDQLVKMCREVVAKLNDNHELSEVNELIERRDGVLTKLANQLQTLTNPSLIEELFSLYEAERVALKPYREELAKCQQALINLKFAKEYLSNDL